MSSTSTSTSAAGGSTRNRQRQQIEKERRLLEAEPDGQTLRILVTTDNHVGYAEDDPVRALDSFRGFDESLRVGALNRVDCAIFGGDLFHENKPSRQTQCRTVEIMRRYVFGDRPVGFEVVSDPALHFPVSGRVNYEDPDFNVQLPVFAIHGNHDDPAGVGGFSAVDLLHNANLLNYFGKTAAVDAVRMVPLLLRKGETRVALYGLGNIRDDRLVQSFRAGGVRWVRPREDPDSWFNILVFHQNRVQHGALQKNVVREDMLPSFLDLVIWGHEHECRLEPEQGEGSQFVVSQPGSSTITSLCAGEAVPKQAGILEVRQGKYRMLGVPLHCVRPLVTRDLSLADRFPGRAGADVSADEVEALLRAEVDALIASAQERCLLHAEACKDYRSSIGGGGGGSIIRSGGGGEQEEEEEEEEKERDSVDSEEEAAEFLGAQRRRPAKGRGKKKGGGAGASGQRQRQRQRQRAERWARRTADMERTREAMLRAPLVRVRVDFTGGFPKLAPRRFGRAFVGKVANPEDVLLFHKRRASRKTARAAPGGEGEGEGAGEGAGAEGHRDGADGGGKGGAPPIRSLVEEYIRATPMAVLDATEFGAALAQYIDKKDNNAFAQFLTASMRQRLEALEQQDAQRGGGGQVEVKAAEDDDAPLVSPAAPAPAPAPAPARKKQRAARSKKPAAASIVLDSSSDESVEAISSSSSSSGDDAAVKFGRRRRAVQPPARKKSRSSRK